VLRRYSRSGTERSVVSESAFDPETWTGDPEELLPAVDEVLDDPDLCDRLFDTKHEAVGAGYSSDA
jgi:hypothetical protein